MQKIIDYIATFTVIVGVSGTITMLIGLVVLLYIGGYSLCQ